MVSIKPAFPPGWTPDDEVDVCSRCTVPFSLILRKHHCRACGKIFCSECSAHNGSIPSYIHKVDSIYTKDGALRMCTGCNSLIVKKKKSKKLILIFSLLPLHIRELEVLLYVGKEWNTAITCIIGIFKALQYKTGYHKWTGIERRLIKTHWREFVGHTRLMIQVFKSLSGIDELSSYTRHFKCSKTHSTCSSLYCDPKLCSISFGPFDILELVYNQHTIYLLDCPELESWIGTCISNLHSDWIVTFLPWFLQIGKSTPAQRIITNNIIPLALDNIVLAYAVYFECELLRSSDLETYYTAIQSRLMTCLDEDTRKEIRRSHKLLHILKDPAKLKTISIDVEGVLLPYDPKTSLRYIVHTGIKQLTSYTKPWVIPMYTSRGKIEILQKNDDLRKDRLVITTMRLLERINERFAFHTYFVFPMAADRGWVEMIPKSKTVYDITKSSSIQNYIISFNRTKSSTILRESFMRSCASNCVLGYMMGLGDRNLHNILVCGESASLAHIDFSYLLGYDPKNIESTEMKITSGMVDMLGGYDSDEFRKLKLFCSSTYNSVRRYTFFWYALFRYLALCNPPIHPHDGDLKSIQNHINSRLMPNATEEEVKVAIVKSVDSNSDSWKSTISDYAHSMKTNLGGLFFNMEL